MFTGIVEELGEVIERSDSHLLIGARTVLADASLGDSIAVNGCCLTVVDHDASAGWWRADVTQETFDRTCLGELTAGSPVNLERPVRLADRLGGHLVQGHVDGVGELTVGIDAEQGGELWAKVPEDLRKYCVEKGSITLDGVSLTIADQRDGAVMIAVIPHTAQWTTLGGRPAGSPLHVEVDVLAKYVENMLAQRGLTR